MVELAPGWRAPAHAPALFTDARTWTYAELRDLSDDMGARLASESGTRRLVFLEARNTPESIAAYLACLRDGHAVYLFDPDADLAGLVERYAPDVVARFAGAAMEVADAGTAAALHPDVRLLLSTSGSTGSPKFVRLSGENVAANAASIAQYLGLTAQDRALTSLKFAYSYGLSVINSHFAAGAALVLTDASVTEPAFWTALRRFEATSFAGVPYTFEVLRGGTQLHDAPSLRYLTQAGGRLAPDLVRHFAREGQARGWAFYVMYGQTEAAPRIAYLPPEQALAHPEAIGVPVPGGALELEANGIPVTETGEEGELIYRGPNVMMGYATSRADLAASKDTFALRTGDLARRNEAGLYVITGRLARIVKPFGLRINLDEVQTAVRAVAPDALATGDDQGLVVAVTRQTDVRPVRQFVTARLKLPPSHVAVDAWPALPRLTNGKPDYRAVLARARAPRSTAPAPSGPLAILLSRRFARETVREMGRLLGIGAGWSSVADIYATLLRVPVDPARSFTELAGDSLTFIQASLALEDYLGQLPPGWEGMAIADLEGLRSDEMAL